MTAAPTGSATAGSGKVVLATSPTISAPTISSPTITGTPTGSATTGTGNVVLATSPTITTPTLSGALGGNLDLGTTNATLFEIANDTTTGTTVNKLAKLTGAPSTVVIAATSDTKGIVGVVVSGAGTTGNARIAMAGVASCVFDNATTAGDYVTISSATAGDCHDAGSTRPGSGQILGLVLSTNGISATPRAISIFPSENVGIPAAAADLSNGTTGTGAVVLATSPTITTPTISNPTISNPTITGTPTGSATTGTGNVVLATSPTIATPTISSPSISNPSFSGTPAGSATTGTGNIVLSTSPTISSPTLSTPTISSPTITGTPTGSATTGTGNVVLATSPTITTPTLSGALGGNLDLGTTNATLFEIANDTTTGTTVNKLAKLTGAPSTAVIAATSDTKGIVGILVGGAGTTSNARIAMAGVASCVFDNATTAGDYVTISSATAGDCRDAGSTRPGSGQILGLVLSTNGVSATPRAISIFPSENVGIPAAAADLSNGTTGTGAVVLATR